jgi:hypothetical protein
MDSGVRRGLPWTRLIVEGGVIVGSILLAFAIDASWEARSDRVQERVLLAALAEDFRIAREEFAEVRVAHRTVLGAMEQLLTWGESGTVPEEQRAQVDTVLSRVFWRETFDPPMGTVATILGSGRLDLLESQELVTALTRWTAVVEDFKELETAGTEHFYQTLYPFLSTNLNLQDLDKGIPREVPWSHAPTEAHRLLSRREFQNVIYVHWVLYWNVDLGIPAVEEAIDRIAQMTAAELAR